MPSSVQFISARVMHARLRPKVNKFGYRVPYLAVPLGRFETKSRQGLLSIDGTNLFSVRPGDYGDGRSPAGQWIRQVLQTWMLSEADGDIVLVSMPRILGFVFNPISFWLCFDQAKHLRAVIAEVNNTFGERHFYVCCHNDHRPILPQDQIATTKVFHVSPFMKVEGEYKFVFAWGEDSFGFRIDLCDDAGPLLITSVSGRREPVTAPRLALSFFANPLVMFKALTLIHYQAVRLFLKGISHFRKPPPPSSLVSR
jgi:DUF1365 family protein